MFNSGGLVPEQLRFLGSGNQGAGVITDFDAVTNVFPVFSNNHYRGRAASLDQLDRASQDHIDISGQGYSSASLGQAITGTGNASNTLVTFVSGTLAGVNVAQINASDFFF